MRLPKYLYSLPERLLPLTQVADYGFAQKLHVQRCPLPDPSYIADWKLTLKGLASGSTVTLATRDLQDRLRFMSRSHALSA